MLGNSQARFPIGVGEGDFSFDHNQSARASHQEVFRVYANYLDVEAPLEPYEVKVSSTVLNGRGRW
ncbi:hypothetical protein B9T07_14705 [Limnospira fusiformis CCALA 023]